jgi:hypothetical protein
MNLAQNVKFKVQKYFQSPFEGLGDEDSGARLILLACSRWTGLLSS